MKNYIYFLYINYPHLFEFSFQKIQYKVSKNGKVMFQLD